MPDLRVTVVYASPTAQFVREVVVASGTTVADAIDASGIRTAAQFDAIDMNHVGVFGRSVDPAAPLRDGDRIEIYRPLKIDPKEARRRRAGKTK